MTDSTPSLASVPASWNSIDPLGEALHFLRLSGTFYTRSEFTAPWGLELPAMTDCLMIHVVTSGQCRLEVGETVCHLRAGDLALVPHGEGHTLTSDVGVPTQKLFDLPREAISDRYEILRLGRGGDATSMICASVRFGRPAAQQLLRLLPRVISVDVWNSPEMEWIQSTLRFMANEAREMRAGGETVITRLADILVIQAIRSWIARDPAAQSGWMAALRDAQIGRAIALIHRDPTRSLTVASMARYVGMSRSAFAARFTQLVGEPAMHYLARWRMQTAMSWLQESDISLAEAASRIGYESEAAFSRAFRRHTGVSPGSVRKRDQLQPVVSE